MKARYLWLGLAVAVAAPWAAVWVGTQPARVEWQCLANVEFDTRIDTQHVVRAWGIMDSDYRPDGSGVARFTGMIRDTRGTSRVHRASEFDYQSLGSMVRITTTRAARLINDDADDEAVYRYLYPGFRVGHTDYFQAMRVGNGAAVAFSNQPRVFCEPPGASRSTVMAPSPASAGAVSSVTSSEAPASQGASAQ